MSAIETLLQLMTDLRDPHRGCPWDIRQTSASIAPHTLDETHELLDAIERNDIKNLQEELGDLLFNIVFHARIAEEQGQFTFEDVADGIVQKMIRRHPHVFGDRMSQKLTEEQLSQQWRELKKEEKTTPDESCFTAESALNSTFYRAREIQKEAARFGFDWPDIDPVIAKLDEEIGELKRAIEMGSREQITDELGDVLFVCVNLARHQKISAEIALRNTNQKFIRRFQYVQDKMAAAEVEMNPQQLQQMEQFWQESKEVVG